MLSGVKYHQTVKGKLALKRAQEKYRHTTKGKLMFKTAQAKHRKTLKYKRTIKRYQLKTMYGISIEEYNSMCKAQQRKCAICRKVSKLQIDHDHKTNELRGLLCLHCNVGLGHFLDSQVILTAALRYLTKYGP